MFRKERTAGKRPDIFQRGHFLKQVSFEESEQTLDPDHSEGLAGRHATLPASAQVMNRNSEMMLLFPGQLPPRVAEGKPCAEVGPCAALAWPGWASHFHAQPQVPLWENEESGLDGPPRPVPRDSPRVFPGAGTCKGVKRSGTSGFEPQNFQFPAV